jgi:hypothetical protein
VLDDGCKNDLEMAKLVRRVAALFRGKVESEKRRIIISTSLRACVPYLTVLFVQV